MSRCGYLWILLAAGAVSVSAINMDVLKSMGNWSIACQPPQPLKDSDLLHGECLGLASLKDVRTLLEQDVFSHLGSLTIINSSLTTNLTMDDLVDFPALHTLTLKGSRLKEWEAAQLVSVPRIRKLVLDQCWDNDTLIAKRSQLTLTITSKLHEALPHLEEIHLLDIFMPRIAKLTSLKNLTKIVIEKGAARCTKENLWMLQWYDAGKMEIDSTVCFVVKKTEEGLEMMHISFSFANRDVVMVWRDIKNAVEDCPVPCYCEVFGYQISDAPIAIVDCNAANLTQLPDIIPSKVTKLHIRNNRITNISKIFTNPRYRSLNHIALDNNLIDHIDGELLCKFLEKNQNLDFRISLANNRLETLPVEHLKRMYNEYSSEGHKYLPDFSLGGNPWNCDDCAFLVPFQHLIFYQALQKEGLKDIRCGKGRHAEGQPIVRLPVRSYCKVDPLLEPLDILNICLGVLLLLFIMNFLYNLVQYQRHGKLPWIVTGFPCCWYS